MPKDQYSYRQEFLRLFLQSEDLSSDNIDLAEALAAYDQGNILQLQDLIGQYLKPELTWVTSIGIISAMETVYEDAISNGNILPETKT